MHMSDNPDRKPSTPRAQASLAEAVRLLSIYHERTLAGRPAATYTADRAMKGEPGSLDRAAD